MSQIRDGARTATRPLDTEWPFSESVSSEFYESVPSADEFRSGCQIQLGDDFWYTALRRRKLTCTDPWNPPAWQYIAADLDR